MTTSLSSRRRRRRLAAIGVAALLAAAGPVVGSARAAAAFTQHLNCPPEQFPPAGSPRNSPSVPFEAPFNATLAGGSLAIDAAPGALAGVTFGAPNPSHPDGTLFGEACGVLGLPGLTGGIPPNPPGAFNNPEFNNNFILHGPPVTGNNQAQNDLIPVPVSLTLQGTGVPLIDGYGSADGEITAQIEPTPAANGGFNIDLQTTAKATAVINPSQLVGFLASPAVLSKLPAAVQQLLAPVINTVVPATGGVCTVAVGNLGATGLPASQVGPFTTPISLTSRSSTNPLTRQTITGKPVTGPITAGQALTVGNTFPVAPISPDMPPSPNLPTGATAPPRMDCTPMSAALFNVLLGLTNGAPAGSATFIAPVTFAAKITA